MLHIVSFVNTGRQKTLINKKFLEEHGGLEADILVGTKNTELEEEVAAAKQTSNQRIMEEKARQRVEWQAHKDREFVRRKRKFLSHKERELVIQTFSKNGTTITSDDIQEAVLHNEEFREMFGNIINSEYQGCKVCSSDGVKQH